MGCNNSKAVAESEALIRCRARKNHLRSAIDHRYALAEANAAHTRALLSMGDAVHRFVHDDLSIASSNSKSTTNPSSSPTTVISESSNTSSTGTKGLTPILHYNNHAPTIPSLLVHHPSDGDNKASPLQTPPSISHQSSNWDFLNPFSTYDRFYQTYPSSMNSTEVREMEGIPDLEDESGELVTGKGNKDKRDLPKRSILKSSRETSSKGTGSRSSEKSSNSKSSPSEKKKSVTFDLETSTLLTERSGPSIGTALEVEGTRDVREAVAEIREQFVVTASLGDKLAKLLEVGKLRYRPKNRVFRVISSRILDYLSVFAYLTPLVKHSRVSSRTISPLGVVGSGREACTFSTILEEHYVWEMKLFQEVKNVEKLKAVYTKKFQRMKYLIARGDDSTEIEPTRVSLDKLLTSMEISIRSITGISTRIQSLRDEELQPELAKLIHSLTEMWNLLLDCHEKQYQVIVNSKTSNLTSKISSDTTATKELEMRILNWSDCFTELIFRYKACAQSLNGWLRNFINEEPEVTPDGVFPYSPGRIEAPPIFVTCNDWFQATERAKEEEVLSAMHSSASVVHNLWEIQDMERQHKLKVESLSKSKVHFKVNKAVEKIKKIIFYDKNRGDVVENKAHGSDLMKIKLDEEERHDNNVQQIHKTASVSLRMTLIPILESLGNFLLDTLNAYEGIRIPKVKVT